MKVFRKNQIVVFTIGLMLIVAGYLNFTNNEKNSSLETGVIIDSEEMAGIGDAKLVSANVVEENTIVNEIEENNSITNSEEDTEIINETNDLDNKENTNKENSDSTNTVETNSNKITTDEYFTNSRLERNTMYSQQIENYQDILSNTNVSETQKKIAQEEITRISNEQNAIMISENLIKTKGIEDLMIFINNDSVNVIVKGDEPKKEEIAQIQNIITRELKANIEDIHIMNKKSDN